MSPGRPTTQGAVGNQPAAQAFQIPALPGSWPRFRGENFDNISREATPLADAWKNHAELGAGVLAHTAQKRHKAAAGQQSQDSQPGSFWHGSIVIGGESGGQQRCRMLIRY